MPDVTQIQPEESAGGNTFPASQASSRHKASCLELLLGKHPGDACLKDTAVFGSLSPHAAQ